MTDFAITGKKGTGKSKGAVYAIRTYLLEGRRVATNLDIDLQAMFGNQSRSTYVRIPDKPSADDLLSAGHGNPESYDEEKNGCMVLDELATWLNSRAFADKGRAATLDYLAHGRKYGWDIYYLMQHINQVDKQVRESFIEHVGRCVRFDKVKIPLIGSLLGGLFGKRWAYLPKFHLCTFRMGVLPTDLISDRWYYGSTLDKCYDTRQIFRADYPHGAHSVLSPWHLVGRHEAPRLTWWARLRAFFAPRPRRPVVHRPKLPVVAALMASGLPSRERHMQRLIQRGLV